jgi:hypothetical protein
MSHYGSNFINAKWLTLRRMDITSTWREQLETLQWCSAHLSRFWNWQKLGEIIGMWEVGAHIRRNWLANWKLSLIYAPCISELVYQGITYLISRMKYSNQSLHTGCTNL